MHICGIWNSDCWPVCSISSICHPSRTPANEDLLIVRSSEVFPNCEDFQIMKLCVWRSPLRPGICGFVVIHWKESWSWPDVAKQLPAHFEEVSFMGRWIFHDFDRQGLARPPFTSRIPLVIGCVGNHWYRKLALGLIHIFVWLLGEIIPLTQPEPHFHVGKWGAGACPGSV